MPRITFFTGILLIVLGAASYLIVYIQTQTSQPTSLIPAGLGILLVGCAILAKDHMRKHMMHAALGIALLGLIAAASRLPTTLSAGKTLAATSQVLMALLCLALLILGVISFINARKNNRGL